MLASSFMTPDQLGISAKGHTALVEVLRMMEGGEIKDEAFNLDNPHICVVGYARVVSGDRYLFGAQDAPYPDALGNIIRMYDRHPSTRQVLPDLNPGLAATARVLRQYLETGESDWFKLAS